jgi:hypothetical protein
MGHEEIARKCHLKEPRHGHVLIYVMFQTEVTKIDILARHTRNMFGAFSERKKKRDYYRPMKYIFTHTGWKIHNFLLNPQ